MNVGSINLVPPSRRPFVVTVTAVVVLALLVLVAWLAAWRWLAAQEEGVRSQAALDRLRSQAMSERQARAAPDPASMPSTQQVSALNAAARALNTPWRDLFDTIESATPATIDLIALEPDSAGGHLALTAEAGSADEMLTYVRRLKREEMVASAVLVSHESVVGSAGSERLRFQLMLHWHGAGRAR